MTEINIYCDESCHLEHDQIEVMILSAISCPQRLTKSAFFDLRQIKEEHGLDRNFELKWTKVSESKQDYFLAVVDYFFRNPSLRFRGLLIPEKSKLRHADYDQDHSTWYFKMYFNLLRFMIRPPDSFNIYIDIRDTRSHKRLEKLNDVLANNIYDFMHESVQVQQVNSHEVELMQMADLFAGAIAYRNRGLNSNAGKLAVVELIKERSRRSLSDSTPLGVTKFNLFRWRGSEEA